MSYEAADRTSDYFGRGLRSLGMAPRDKICIFADTRAGIEFELEKNLDYEVYSLLHL